MKKVMIISMFILWTAIALSSGAVLFNDDFTDGSRDGWWKLNDDSSYNVAVVDDTTRIGSGNALAFTDASTGIHRLVANFDTVPLETGDSVALSFDVRLNGVVGSSYGLRFGLHDNMGSLVNADYSGDSSGPAAYDKGYYVRMDTGISTDLQIYKDVDESLLGGSDVIADYRQYSGTYLGINDEKKHHVDFIIKRTSDGIEFKLYLDGYPEVDASKSTSYPVTAFNEITFASHNAGIDFLIDNVKVTLNDWRVEVDARIEQVRKGNFHISVVSPYDSKPLLPGVKVNVEQVGHHFAFGSAMSNSYSDPAYASFFKEHFEWATPEYQAKWPINEPSRDNVTYRTIDGLYDFCQTNEIKVRGHCLFWGRETKIQDWVKALPLNELQLEMEERAVSAVNHFKDKFVHWDVNNEMVDNTYYKDLLGDSIRIWMFQRVHEIDPACMLFVNDYGIISGNGYNLSDYKTQIADLLASGAPVQGVGVQCHMGSDFSRTAIEDRFDSLAEAGLPIWVTEFDMKDLPDAETWADYLEEFYRTAFSHPAVKGIIAWGFWEGNGANSPIVNTDWTLNAAGIRYEALMDEWTTMAQSVTNGNGIAEFRGFYGTYRVTMPLDGAEPTEKIIEITPEGTNEFVLELSGMLPSPAVNGDFESGECKGPFTNGYPEGWSGWGTNGRHHTDDGYKQDNAGIAIWDNDTACVQPIAALEGEQFVVSAEMIYSPDYMLHNKNGILRIEFWDGPLSSGVKLAETDIGVLTPTHLSDTWYTFTETVTALEGTKAARIVCLTVSTGSLSTGKVYWDNISVEKVRANFNGDSAVDFLDFTKLADTWNQNSPVCDLTGDSYVGLDDLMVFVSEWLLVF